MARWKIQTLELMKVLSDPRRTRILSYADEPVTVKSLAEQLNEKPSRLYYHVKKLVDVGMLEIVETRQHGNLVEKYYQAVDQDVIYKGDVHQQAEHIQLTLALLHKRLDPGVKLYEKALEKVREEKEKGKTDIKRLPYQISIDSVSERKTAEEWRKSIEPIMKAMGNPVKNQDPWPEHPADELSPEEAAKEGTYQYLLVSYRVEDAEKLGLIESETEEKETD